MFTKQIQKLEKKLKALKAKEVSYKRKTVPVSSKNAQMKAHAKEYRKDLLSRMTNAEHLFQRVASSHGIYLEPQHIIYIMEGNTIVKFFIADFCDRKNKYIFEIDGGYHDTKRQQRNDTKRTLLLEDKGYRVFRLSNKDVYQGKGVELLNNIYPQFF